MWIYDGEEWTEEGVSEQKKKTDQEPRPEEEYRPELEIVEIVPRTNYNPPPPMP